MTPVDQDHCRIQEWAEVPEPIRYRSGALTHGAGASVPAQSEFPTPLGDVASLWYSNVLLPSCACLMQMWPAMGPIDFSFVDDGYSSISKGSLQRVRTQ